MNYQAIDESHPTNTRDLPPHIEALRVADESFYIEMAGANITSDINAIVNGAFLESGESYQSLAAKLNVSPERIKELLHSKGIMPTSSLGRLLGALGYSVEFTVLKETRTQSGGFECEEVSFF